MEFLISFFNLLFTLLSFAIIARALVSWIPVDRYHPAIQHKGCFRRRLAYFLPV